MDCHLFENYLVIRNKTILNLLILQLESLHNATADLKNIHI